MRELLVFAGALLALVPLVIALVKAVVDDAPGIPRWGKRVLAIVFGVVVAVGVQVFLYRYSETVLPLDVVFTGGVALGLQAAGIYDFGRLLASTQRK